MVSRAAKNAEAYALGARHSNVSFSKVGEHSSHGPISAVWFLGPRGSSTFVVNEEP